MADELTSSSSLSDLQITETDIVIFTEMPDEVQAIINNYVPLDGNDNTKDILRETFKYLPPAGRVHMVEDILESAEKDTSRQLSLSIFSGLLTPIKVAGATPSGRDGWDEPLEEPEKQLRDAAMARDGGKCVIYRETESECMLEATHIVPFALARWESNVERDQKMAVWENIVHYFHSVSTRLGFHYQDINSLQNVMILSLNLHREFGWFTLALEETGTLHEYRIQDIPWFQTGPLQASASESNHHIHCAIAHILHATGEGKKIQKALNDADAIGGFAASGSTNIAELFSVTELAMAPVIRQLNKHLKLQSPKISDTMESPIAPPQSANPKSPRRRGLNATRLLDALYLATLNLILDIGSSHLLG